MRSVGSKRHLTSEVMGSVHPDGATCHLVIDLGVFTQCGQRGSRVFVSQNGGTPPEADFHVLLSERDADSEPNSDCFGPMNVLSIIRFVETLDSTIARASPQSVVYSIGSDRRDMTNAAFLLGAYMVLKLGQDPSYVASCFKGIDESLLERFSDSSSESTGFELTLIDCWRGLNRGREKGWFTVPTITSQRWGRIGKDDYAHYNNPFNGDLHEVVPEKFIAFRSPKNLGGPKVRNSKSNGTREFSAGYYADVFRVLGVSTVVRLNDPDYDATPFVLAGIQHVDLSFGDSSSPALNVMGKFFRIVDGAEGLVAVHCTDGLGRTGTLIALYMMRSYGFAAREAIAWLRIMRPGSVAGAAQQFLCGIEARVLELKPAPAAPAAEARPAPRPIRSCLKKRLPSPEPGWDYRGAALVSAANTASAASVGRRSSVNSYMEPAGAATAMALASVSSSFSSRRVSII